MESNLDQATKWGDAIRRFIIPYLHQPSNWIKETLKDKDFLRLAHSDIKDVSTLTRSLSDAS